MNEQLESDIQELVQAATERALLDEEAEYLTTPANNDGDPGMQAWAVVMLRLRAGAYALGFQADLLRRLVDEGDMVGALDCLDFMSALARGFEAGAQVVIASFLPERFI